MDKNVSIRKAVRLHCMLCNGEVKSGKKYDCLCTECDLYPWKEAKGVYEYPELISETHKEYIKNLKHFVKKTRVVSEEQKAAFSARMKKAWETRKANKQE